MQCNKDIDAVGRQLSNPTSLLIVLALQNRCDVTVIVNSDARIPEHSTVVNNNCSRTFVVYLRTVVENRLLHTNTLNYAMLYVRYNL